MPSVPSPLCESDLPDEMFEGLLETTAEKKKQLANAAKNRNYQKVRKHPCTSEQDYSTEELEFMFAYHEYKQKSGNKFPTLKETFLVFMALGYTKRGQSQVA